MSKFTSGGIENTWPANTGTQQSRPKHCQNRTSLDSRCRKSKENRHFSVRCPPRARSSDAWPLSATSCTNNYSHPKENPRAMACCQRSQGTGHHHQAISCEKDQFGAISVNKKCQGAGKSNFLGLLGLAIAPLVSILVVPN